jgi:hypothetical protein
MIKYNVDYDNKSVTAYFEGGRKYWNICLSKMVFNITYDLDFDFPASSIISKIVVNYPLSATVKCHPNDTFDVEIGKQLAKEKLKNRFNKCKIRVLKTLADYSIKEFTQLNNRIAQKMRKGVKSK